MLSKNATLKLQRVQNSPLRFAYNEKYPYTYTTMELHRKADLLPININIYHRGRKVMNKLVTSINDTTYNNIIENNDTQEHSWFRKSFRTLIGPESTPHHIYRHLIKFTLPLCTSITYQRNCRNWPLCPRQLKRKVNCENQPSKLKSKPHCI